MNSKFSKKHIVIIGGGPAGHTAALEAADLGMDVVLIEEKYLGGVCLNKGCIPTKLCLQAIKAEEQSSIMGTPMCGEELSARVERWKGRQRQLIESMRYGSGFLADRRGVRIIDGKGIIVSDKKVKAELVSGEEEYFDCDAVIIATGSKERILSFGGDVNYYSLDDMVTLNDLPKEISIMGSGTLGVELAVILQSLGVKVYIIEKADRLLPAWDEEISLQMKNYLECRDIEMMTSCDKPVTRNVVSCIGREPVMPEMSVTLQEKLILQNSQLHSGATACLGPDWLYGAGDCISLEKDAAMAMEQGRRAVWQIAGKEEALNEAVTVPKCIYTPLEAAMAGKTEKELIKNDIKYKSHFYSIVQTGTGMLENLSQGFIKVLVEKESGVLLGFHIMSLHASEIIMICQMAVEAKMTAKQFVALNFPHPTESEYLKTAVYELIRSLE